MHAEDAVSYYLLHWLHAAHAVYTVGVHRSSVLLPEARECMLCDFDV